MVKYIPGRIKSLEIEREFNVKLMLILKQNTGYYMI